MKASILLSVAPLAVQATSGGLPTGPGRVVVPVKPTATSSIDPNTVSKDWLQRPETKSQFQTQYPHKPPKTFSTITTPTVKPSPPSRTSQPVVGPSKGPQGYRHGPPPRYKTKTPHQTRPKVEVPTTLPTKVAGPKRPSPKKPRPHRPAQTRYPVSPGPPSRPPVRRDDGSRSERSEGGEYGPLGLFDD
ncbi:hypothetical protein SCUP234_05602 [Seiridium cupressi]